MGKVEEQMDNIKEIKGDLFENIGSRTPVHCIAADHRMGKGIALPMARKYNLYKAFPGRELLPWPSCQYVNGVMNLVTKKSSWDKPTYEDLRAALVDLRKVCLDSGITRLVMPRIGCGLDSLSWPVVRLIIRDELPGFDILVCFL